MALNTLTISVSNGVIGRPFMTAVSGITAGNLVEVMHGSTLGFGYSNGKLVHSSLPSDAQMVILRERNQVTGESKLTNLVISAAGSYAIKQQADALVPGNTGFRIAAVAQGDGSLLWTLFVDSAAGATTSAAVSGGARITLTPATATAGVAYSGTISGNTGTVTATSTDGTTLTVVGSALSGTFTAAGNITVSLTDSLGTVNVPFSVAVNPSPPSSFDTTTGWSFDSTSFPSFDRTL